MTRVTRRGIVRALRAPGAEPPADLAAKIKEAIPEDLFAARGAQPSSRRRTPSLARWAIAASLLVGIGSGYLASRRFDQQREAVPDRADRIATVAESSPAEPPSTAPPSRPAAPVAPLDDLDHSAAEKGKLEREVVAPSAGSDAAEQEGEAAEQALDALGMQTDTAAPQAELGETTAAAAEIAAAELDKVEPEPAPKVSWRAERRTEIAQRSVGMRNESRAAASFDAPSAERDATSDRAGYLDVDTHPLSTLAVSAGDPSLQAAAGAARDSAVAVPLEEIVDAAAQRRGATGRDAIAVEGGPARTPGYVDVLFSAVLAESDPRDAGTRKPGSMEIELDPAAARSYRLLASHAQPLEPAPADASANAGRLYRVTALYEIELARDLRPGAALGGVRLREGGSAGVAAPATPFGIGGADLADSWDETRADLKLAVLAAELAFLPPDASAARRASIARELERLLADTSLDEAVARRAAELEAILSVLGR